jgi:hypothetical protein
MYAFIDGFKKLVLAMVEMGSIKVKLEQTGMPWASSPFMTNNKGRVPKIQLYATDG